MVPDDMGDGWHRESNVESVVQRTSDSGVEGREVSVQGSKESRQEKALPSSLFPGKQERLALP